MKSNTKRAPGTGKVYVYPRDESDGPHRCARPSCTACGGTGWRCGELHVVPCPPCMAAFRFGPQATVNRIL